MATVMPTFDEFLVEAVKGYVAFESSMVKMDNALKEAISLVQSEDWEKFCKSADGASLKRIALENVLKDAEKKFEEFYDVVKDLV